MTKITSGYARTLFALSSLTGNAALAREARAHGAAVEITRRAFYSAPGNRLAHEAWSGAMDQADGVLERLMATV